MKNWDGHFTPELGGHFELESGGHFKLELGGQYHRNMHLAIKNVLFQELPACALRINNQTQVL